MGDQYWVTAAHHHSRFQEVPHLRSVLWQVAAGSFLVFLWGPVGGLGTLFNRLLQHNLLSGVFDNHEYKKDKEDPCGYLKDRSNAAYLSPRNDLELFNRTAQEYDPVDISNAVPDTHHNDSDNNDTKHDYWAWHWNFSWYARTTARRTAELLGIVTIA
ncbi:hypothetical protein BGZ93_004946 [Podila epicladia]|nr:hypothetical protein BGZ92_009382 [Podila epicladia]KAG0096156.1 hypothetical protein BGZ93_004946 [Podila epicladia]